MVRAEQLSELSISTEAATVLQDQLFAIFAQAGVGLALAELDGQLIAANHTFLGLLGRSAAELKTLTTADVTHPDDIALEQQVLAEMRAGLRDSATTEKRYIRPDGSSVWVQLTRTEITDSTGIARYGLAIAQDITARKDAEIARAALLRQMERLVDSSTTGIMVGDREGRIVLMNATLLTLLGYTEHDVTHSELRWTALTPPEFAERDGQAVAELHATGRCAPYEKQLIAADGRRVPVLVGASVIDWSANGDRVVAAYVTDLSVQKRQQRDQLLLTELSELLTSSLEADALVGQIVRFLTMHLADSCEFYLLGRTAHDDLAAYGSGVSAEAPILRSFAAVRGDPGGAPPPLVTRVARMREQLRTDITDLAALEAVAPDARPGWKPGPGAVIVVSLKARGTMLGAIALLRQAGSPTYDAQDQALAEEIARRCSLALDHAQLYRATQHALDEQQQTRALLDGLLENAPVGITFFDRQLRYQLISANLAAINGFSPDAHIGRTVAEMAPFAVHLVEPIMREVLHSGHPQTVLLTHSTPAEPVTPGHWLVTFYPLRRADGQITGVGGVRMDVDAVVRAEAERAALIERAEAAQAAAEMATAQRDQFIAVAAHEIRNPLTSLLAQAYLLERDLAESDTLTPTIAQALSVITSQTRRVALAMTDLLETTRLASKQIELSRQAVRVSELLQRCVAAVAPQYPEHVLELNAADAEVWVYADPSRLLHVFEQLLHYVLKRSPQQQHVPIEQHVLPEEVVVEFAIERASADDEYIDGASPLGQQAEIALFSIRELVKLHGGAFHIRTVGRVSRYVVRLPRLHEE